MMSCHQRSLIPESCMIINMRLISAIFLFFTLLLSACASTYKAPDLGGLYNSLVQNESPYRNPVVLIPGLMGSKLVDSESGSVVWGAFGSGSVNANSPDGAKLLCLLLFEYRLVRSTRSGRCCGKWVVAGKRLGPAGVLVRQLLGIRAHSHCQCPWNPKREHSACHCFPGSRIRLRTRRY